MQIRSITDILIEAGMMASDIARAEACLIHPELTTVYEQRQVLFAVDNQDATSPFRFFHKDDGSYELSQGEGPAETVREQRQALHRLETEDAARSPFNMCIR